MRYIYLLVISWSFCFCEREQVGQEFVSIIGNHAISSEDVQPMGVSLDSIPFASGEYIYVLKGGLKLCDSAHFYYLYFRKNPLVHKVNIDRLLLPDIFTIDQLTYVGVDRQINQDKKINIQIQGTRIRYFFSDKLISVH